MSTLEIHFGTLPKKKKKKVYFTSQKTRRTNEEMTMKIRGKSESHAFIGKSPVEVVRIHSESCKLPTSELTSHPDNPTSRIN